MTERQLFFKAAAPRHTPATNERHPGSVLPQRPARTPKGTRIPRLELWLGTAAFLMMSPTAAFADFNLRILHTNDVHAHYEQTMEDGSTCTSTALEAGSWVGGAARLATRLKELRKGVNALYLDAGDQFQGTLFYYRYKEQAPLDILNLLKPDAQTLGNHEFDGGPAVTAKYLAAITSRPVISANIVDSGEPASFQAPIPASAVIEVGGQKIGVVGLTTVDTPRTSRPGDTVTFKPELEALRAAVNELRGRGIDKIIALTHVGYDDDVKLASEVDGVDIFVGGHSHTLLSNSDRKASGAYPTLAKSASGEPVLVVQAGSAGIHLGQLDVVFDDKGVLKSWSGDAPVLTADIAQDPEVKGVVDTTAKPLAELRAQKVGESAGELSNAECRAKECALGDLVADAILAAANGDKAPKADLALITGGSLRSSLHVGAITMGQLLEVLPFFNHISTVEVTGAALAEDLDNGVELACQSNASGNGRFPQVSGLRFAFDASERKGQRITKIEVEMAKDAWAALDPARTYRVATIDFNRQGGDGYNGLKMGINANDEGPDLVNVVESWLKTHSPVPLPAMNRINGKGC
jgi:5'-nucleotidase / UDP-sugar diphosphatase